MDFHRITVYRPKLTAAALLRKQRSAILGFLKTFHTHPLNQSTVSEMSIYPCKTRYASPHSPHELWPQIHRSYRLEPTDLLTSHVKALVRMTLHRATSHIKVTPSPHILTSSSSRLSKSYTRCEVL